MQDIQPREISQQPRMQSARWWAGFLLPLLSAAALSVVSAAEPEADFQLRLAGQALRQGHEHEAVSRLAHSIRLQPEQNPATTALLVLLTFRDHPLPLYTSEWTNIWLQGDWLSYRPEFSHDGKFLFWAESVLEVRGDTLAFPEKGTGPEFPGSDHAMEMTERLAKVAERGSFIGHAMPDFATNTKERALASADRSVAMILPEAWLGDSTFPLYSRYSVSFPHTLAFAFPPDRSDRLATLEHAAASPPYSGGRLRLWDIRPSAPQAPPQVEDAPHVFKLPDNSVHIAQVFLTPGGKRRCLLEHRGGEISLADPDDDLRLLWTSPRPSDARNRVGYRSLLADGSALIWWEASRFRSDEASSHDRSLVDVENGDIIETFPADEHPFRVNSRGPWLMLDRGALGGVLYDSRKRKVVLRSGIDADGQPEWRPAGLVDPDRRYWLLRRAGDSALLDLETLEIAGRVPLAEDGSHAADDFAAYHEGSGRLALGNQWGDTRLYQPAENRLLFEYPRQHAFYKDVSCHAWFHPDGSRLYLSIGISESEENSELHVWDTVAGRFIAANSQANLHHPGWHERDGRGILFSHRGYWMLGENFLGAPILFDAATGGRQFHAVGTRSPSLNADMTRAVLQLGEAKAPAWLAELAEWTSGIRISEDDVPVDTGLAYDLGFLTSLRGKLLAAPQDEFTRWALWFLGDREERASWLKAEPMGP